MASNSSILALDVGEARIGVALASNEARLASPHGVINNDEQAFRAIADLCKSESIGQVVVGLPRGLDGQETQQTQYSRDFAAKLASHLDIPLSLVDEAGTSKLAEAELNRRGKPFAKGDIDALAATYILEDYLAQGEGEKV